MINPRSGLRRSDRTKNPTALRPLLAAINATTPAKMAHVTSNSIG
jgi:hypothetical protein